MKTIIWQSDFHQLEKLTHTHPQPTLFHRFIRQNLGKPAVITLSNGEKMNAILTHLSRQFFTPLIVVERNTALPTIIRSDSIVAVGLNREKNQR